MSKSPTVFVGLSGGVDSSVAALRLKKCGFTVVGVFIKVWHPEFMVCNWEAERLDAMRVAAHLEIPFLTCDAEATYRDEVATYFISEYQAGRTPNPDVLCNKEVKFGAFMHFAKEYGADFIATGHYVQHKNTVGVAELHRGIDANKDQSYFLWSLSPEQLAFSIFPVGDSEKAIIRKEAAEAGIPTAEKKDSQGVCFLGHIDIPEFLSHYIDLIPGKVLDIEGNTVGIHQSALVYTIGQRHGFTLTNQNTNRHHHYVVAKNIEQNTIIVSAEPEMTVQSDTILLTNAMVRSTILDSEVLTAQFRYRQAPFEIRVLKQTTDSLSIEVIGGTEKAASGQSCVLYRGSLCVGGGIIK